MTSDPPPRRRATIREQWREHGTHPAPERWARRAGMIAGALVALAVLVVAGRVAGWALLAVWRATGWS